MKSWGAGRRLFSEHGIHAVASGPGADIALGAVNEGAARINEFAAACQIDDPASRLELLGAIDTVFQAAASAVHEAKSLAHLTLLVVVGERVYVGHAGEVRLDRIRDPERERICDDLPYHELGRLPKVDADLFEMVVTPGDLLLLGTPGALESAEPLVGRRPRQLAAGLVDALDEKHEDACVILYESSGTTGERILAAILSKQPLFEHFDPQALRRIRPYLREVHLAKKEVVFEVNSQANELFLVVAGRVDVAREGMPLTTLGSGDHFGEIGLVLGSTRTATVTARSACHLLALDRDRLNALLNDRPDLAGLFMNGLVESLAERVADLTERVVEANRS